MKGGSLTPSSHDSQEQGQGESSKCMGEWQVMAPKHTSSYLLTLTGEVVLPFTYSL